MISLLFSVRDDFESSPEDNTLFVNSKQTHHTHTGVNEMDGIISRLSDLSDALQHIELYPEAKLVQEHITKLTTDSYHQKVMHNGIESVLSEFVNEFD